jgi:hypothetical protein
MNDASGHTPADLEAAKSKLASGRFKYRREVGAGDNPKVRAWD